MKFLNPNLSDEENDVPEKSRELTEAEDLSSAAEKEEKAPRAGIVSAMRAWFRSHKRITIAIGICLLLLVQLLPLTETIFWIRTVDGVTYSYDWATGQYGVSDFDNSREEITIPGYIENVPITVIQEGAFRDCDRLQKITLSENIQYIGKNAFINCFKLSVATYCEHYVVVDRYTEADDDTLFPRLQVNSQAFGSDLQMPEIETLYKNSYTYTLGKYVKSALIASYLALWNWILLLGSVGYFIYSVTRPSSYTHLPRMILAGTVVFLTILPFLLAGLWAYIAALPIPKAFYPIAMSRFFQILVLPVSILIGSWGLTFLQEREKSRKAAKWLFLCGRTLGILIGALLFPLTFPEFCLSSHEALPAFCAWAAFLLETDLPSLLLVISAAVSVLSLVQMRRTFWHSLSGKAAFWMFLPAVVTQYLSTGTASHLNNFLKRASHFNLLEPIYNEWAIFSFCLLFLGEILAWVAFFLIRRGEKRTQGAIHSEEEVHQ